MQLHIKIRTLFFTFISALCLQTPTTHTITNTDKSLAFLFSSIILSHQKDTVSAHHLTKKLADLTNTDSRDLVDATALSLYYWAFSYFYNAMPLPLTRRWATDLRYQATIQPLIQIAATSKTYNNLIKKIPGIKTLACADAECPGVCDQCEYKHLVRKAPLELGTTIAHEICSKKINHELEVMRIRHNHAQVRQAARDAAANAVDFARQQAVRDLDGQAGTCSVCLEEGLPLFSQLCPNLCAGSSICNACTQEIINAAPGGIAEARCPGCRGQGPALAIPPREPFIPALHLQCLERASNKLLHLALWEPFWTLCRRNNVFIYRAWLELRKLNPLISRHISCKNRDCKSICHECKLKKVFHIHDWAKYLIKT